MGHIKEMFNEEMTVAQAMSRFREEVVIGMNGENFTNCLKTMDQLDGIRLRYSRPMIEHFESWRKSGLEKVNKFCFEADLHLVKNAIYKEYSELGVRI